MLSYRHTFHAGNFADVHKHLVLSLLMKSLLNKEAGFCYLDTHSGAGRYDLHSPEAQKNTEFENGIGRLWQQPDLPATVQPYLDAVRACNTSSALHYYPGSPRIARYFLRPQDRMILTELHPADARQLQWEFANDPRVTVHHLDGYQGLKAFLPPPERRGLVLMDPAYERRDETKHMIESLQTAARRWAQGIYALWFPVTNRAGTADFYKRLKKTGLRKVLITELCVRPPLSARQLNGSVMAIVNPPWQLDEILRALMPWLAQTLAMESRGESRTEWLVPE